ncbi:Rossmann-like domain-containing protein [Anaeroselena agilis]|uniref:DUF364 domain-containing protein n=1 Tax=Anaeroselena agilis TaxID=3063788 RepID=A0ABU3NT34_9FIRM|nr:DUF364 domain-containing protein [Selenomonadales bacterium 4137-cl]
MSMLEEARRELIRRAAEGKWDENEQVHIVSARNLTPEEAIGKPDRDDYPLLKGKEVMMEARYRDGVGQAYTDQPGHFSGTLREVLHMPLDTNFRRAVFVATLNAVMRSLQQVEATVHCKDKEPALCAQQLPAHIENTYGRAKIAFVGLQPALIQSLVDAGFELKVTDLNPDNVGQTRCGVRIDDAALNADNARWADIVLSTGSVLVNDTYHELLQGKPVIYYGVTTAGLAKLFDLPRFCYCGR